MLRPASVLPHWLLGLLSITISDSEVYKPGDFAINFLDSGPAYFRILGIEIIDAPGLQFYVLLAATAFLLPESRTGFQSLGGILVFPQLQLQSAASCPNLFDGLIMSCTKHFRHFVQTRGLENGLKRAVHIQTAGQPIAGTFQNPGIGVRLGL
ncbi:hypothetical protein OBBRIDRAFT_808704 [Obba rivulosa]|uniref:Uncharacterized protein n=1 Tax=Obba rivulosa TaxID=1052685 RepID=A0A8E2AG41_9APHY|nr:hypothetical protein OBBRIDRAFT_808704 [Obba rivulosa]